MSFALSGVEASPSPATLVPIFEKSSVTVRAKPERPFLYPVQLMYVKLSNNGFQRDSVT
jgi:hypothetical protein